MAQAGEHDATQETWWNPAQAVIFLRDGTNPSATDTWFGLPSAVKETRQLNAAIQAGKIDVIELHVDGTRRQLRAEDKACIELHFRHFVGGTAGVKLEVVDTPTNKARREIKTLLLRAEHVRVLRDKSTSPVLLSPSDLATADADESGQGRRRTVGAKPKFDWDAIQAECNRRFDDGYPENISEFCRALLEWCQEHFGERVFPDERTMRRYVTKWLAAWERSLPPEK